MGHAVLLEREVASLRCFNSNCLHTRGIGGYDEASYNVSDYGPFGDVALYRAKGQNPPVKYWELIADKLSSTRVLQPCSILAGSFKNSSPRGCVSVKSVHSKNREGWMRKLQPRRMSKLGLQQ